MGKYQFSSEELAGFCEQVCIVLKSGIGLEEGMYMLAEEIEEKRSKQIMKDVEQSLEKNESFAQALKQTKAFPPYLCNMVEIGETSGKLDEVMAGLQQYYTREHIMKSSIRNVVSYPLFLFFMISVILAALVGWIMPMFQNVFDNLNVDAASSSSKIMKFGIGVGTTVSILAACLILFILAGTLWYQTEAGKQKVHGFVTVCPFTKKTADLLAKGKLIASLSVMLSSGMEARESLEMAEQVVEHNGLKKKMQACVQRLETEAHFAETLRDENIFTGMQGRMLALADKAGVLDEAMDTVRTSCDEEIGEQLTSLCSKLETALVVALSLVIGGVLIAVMFPLVSIITSIG